MTDFPLDVLAPGDHICWIFERDAEYLPTMARFVRAGLAQRQRVVCLTGAGVPDLADGLAGRGGLAGAVGSGQVWMGTATDMYLSGGRFDPAAVIGSFSRHIDEAIADGYTGVRVIADMGWAAGYGHLPGYEERVNALFLDGRALGVCLYDRRLFPAPELYAASCAHPGTVGPEPSTDWAPMLRTRRTGPARLSLSGEADLTNRQALATILSVVVSEAEEPVRLDVGGLTFVDAGTAALFARAALRAPAGLAFVGVTPAVRQVLSLTGVAALPGVSLSGAGR
jgi:anti-anti-sigma regulatory factor